METEKTSNLSIPEKDYNRIMSEKKSLQNDLEFLIEVLDKEESLSERALQAINDVRHWWINR